MAWCRIGDTPLFEPMLIRFIDASDNFRLWKLFKCHVFIIQSWMILPWCRRPIYGFSHRLHTQKKEWLTLFLIVYLLASSIHESNNNRTNMSWLSPQQTITTLLNSNNDDKGVWAHMKYTEHSWGPVISLCIIGSGNGLSPVWYQGIAWTKMQYSVKMICQ